MGCGLLKPIMSWIHEFWIMLQNFKVNFSLICSADMKSMHTDDDDNRNQPNGPHPLHSSKRKLQNQVDRFHLNKLWRWHLCISAWLISLGSIQKSHLKAGLIIEMDCNRCLFETDSATHGKDVSWCIIHIIVELKDLHNNYILWCKVLFSRM